MRFARVTYFVIAAGAALWCLMILLPALLTASGGSPGQTGQMIAALFRPLCHRLDERSFHLFGVALAVCSRCSSIYFGFLLGTLAYPLIRDLRAPVVPGRIFLAAAAFPMLVDVASGMLGLYEVTNVSRALTGGWFGLLSPYLVIPGATEAMDGLLHRAPPTMNHSEKGPTDA
jgi:uncharacterized membrane protein